MTARPGRGRRGSTVSAPGPFPDVRIPVRVLAEARAKPGTLDRVEVVESYLRDNHGPMPDHREKRARWFAWVEAVEERALGLLADGTLNDDRAERG